MNSPRTLSVLTCLLLAPAAAVAAQPEPLQAKLSTASMPNTFGQALAWVGSQVDMKVRVDASTLEAYGVSLDQKVALARRKSPASAVLDSLLVRVSPPGRPLTWMVHDGKILITSQKRFLLIRSGAGSPGRPLPAADGSAPAARPPARPGGGARGADNYNFDNIPLAAVIQFMRTTTGQNFHVNWPSLQTVGIDKQTTIELQVRRVSAARVLDLICEQLNANRDKFSSVYWIVDGGVVTLATGTALNQKTETRVYDIAHALMPIRDFDAPNMNLRTTGRLDDDDDDDDDGDLFDDDDDEDDDQDDEDDDKDLDEIQELRQRNADSIVSVIKNAIGEDMWHPTGKGSVQIVNNKLVVTQTQLGFKLLDQALRFAD